MLIGFSYSVNAFPSLIEYDAYNNYGGMLNIKHHSMVCPIISFHYVKMEAIKGDCLVINMAS